MIKAMYKTGNTQISKHTFNARLLLTLERICTNVYALHILINIRVDIETDTERKLVITND